MGSPTSREDIDRLIGEASRGVLGCENDAAIFDLIDSYIDLIFKRNYTTVLCYPNRSTAVRVYSTIPAVYPEGVRKPLPDNARMRGLLDEARPFVANSLDEITAEYPDHDVVRSLDTSNLANIPIVFEGRVLGVVCIAGSDGPRGPSFAGDVQPFANLLGPLLARIRDRTE